jgi:hypothetical protein
MKPARPRSANFVPMADPASAGQSRAQVPKHAPSPAPEPTPKRPPAPAVSAEPAPSTGERQLRSRLDGLRGWLAELDRIVSTRTKVGLVLLALAVGFGAASLYLALDAREHGASKARVESLREALQVLNRRSGHSARELARLRAAVRAADAKASGAGSTVRSLQAQFSQLRAQAQAQSGAGAGTGSGGAGGLGAGTSGAGSK